MTPIKLEQKHAPCRAFRCQKKRFFKAVGTKISLKDNEIINRTTENASRFTTDKAPGVKVHISISHVKNYAVANAIATKKT
jgi:phosphopantetheinyl transferase (holo-ACP synthase)